MSDTVSYNSEGDDPESHETYRELVHSIDGIVWEARADTLEFTYVSPQSSDLLGYPPSAWYEEASFWEGKIHPDDRRETVRFCKAQTVRGKDHQFEYRMRRADGSYIWLRDQVTVVTDGGRPVKLRGVMLDITKEKELEEEKSLIRYMLEQRMIELQCLYRISSLDQQELSIEELLSRALEIIPDGLQYPDVTAAVITHNDQRYQTSNFRETEWSLGVTAGDERGHMIEIKVVYLEAMPESDDGPFMKEERALLESISSRLALKMNEIFVRQELEEKVDELNRLVRYSPNLVAVASEDGYFKMINPTFSRLLGYREEDLLSSPFLDFVHPDDRKSTEEQFAQNVNAGQITEAFEIRFQTREGEWRWISWHSSNWNPEKGEILAYGSDVTRQKMEEQRLRLFESVVTNTQEAVAVIEAVPDELPGRKILYVNQGFVEMTGYTREEVLGKTLHFLNGPNTDPEERRKIKDAMKKFQPGKAEFINYRKNGEEFWVNLSMVPVKDENWEYSHWVVIGRDVTDRQRYQEQVLESLVEKETLLAEIHHRVKNNLAVVSGMMQLQADDEENQEVASRLLDSVVRIKSMATIHEQLYQSRNFSRLDFSENTRSLVTDIVGAFQPTEEIEIDFDCQPVELNINQAIPCSLILNEVITNILKYAFKGRDKGKITVLLSDESPDGKICMTVWDNGVGLPENFEEITKTSLGMSLIEVLSDQLEGTYRYESEGKGTVFSIRFARSDKKGIGNSFIS